jgi:hypothetical protein
VEPYRSDPVDSYPLDLVPDPYPVRTDTAPAAARRPLEELLDEWADEATRQSYEAWLDGLARGEAEYTDEPPF